MDKKDGKRYQVGNIEELMDSQWFSDLVTAQSNRIMPMLENFPQTQETFNIVHTAFGAGYLLALTDFMDHKIGIADMKKVMEGYNGKARSN